MESKIIFSVVFDDLRIGNENEGQDKCGEQDEVPGCDKVRGKNMHAELNGGERKDEQTSFVLLVAVQSGERDGNAENGGDDRDQERERETVRENTERKAHQTGHDVQDIRHARKDVARIRLFGRTLQGSLRLTSVLLLFHNFSFCGIL